MWKDQLTEDIKNNASKYLEDLINDENIIRVICSISEDSEKDEVISVVKKYGRERLIPYPKGETGQSGRLWLLVGTCNGRNVALTAGQSLDIIEEIIKKCINNMFGEEDTDARSYYSMLRSYDKLTYYEVDINGYLMKEFGEICSANGIVKIVFDMAKEYMAEAAVACYTNAEYWNCYYSGMDKRALFHLLFERKK